MSNAIPVCATKLSSVLYSPDNDSSRFEFNPTSLLLLDHIGRSDDCNGDKKKRKTDDSSTASSDTCNTKGTSDEMSADPTDSNGCSAKWTRGINHLRRPVMIFLQALASTSARKPRLTILAICLLSTFLMLAGLATNFYFEVDEAALWTPFGSKPKQDSAWIETESGFPPIANGFALLFHSDGKNVLGQQQVSQIFDALDSVRNLDGYDETCQNGMFDLPDGTKTCEIFGASRFWLNNRTEFEQEVSSDEDAILAMSSIAYSDGIPIDEDMIFGQPQRVYSTGLLTSALSYLVVIVLPETDETKEFEEKAIDAILALRAVWAAQPDVYSIQMELWTARSIGDEYVRFLRYAVLRFLRCAHVFVCHSFVEIALFVCLLHLPHRYTRAVVADLPLIPIVFVLMTVFTSLVFFKRHKVHSRSLLGVGAVTSVLLSMVSSYGLMFLCGVPFTSVAQLLPFVMFGIGLDDSYIIMGAYSRLAKYTDPVERIKITIDEIGLSITLTSMTSALAFGLGCISSIPAIYWLCLYAFPAIIFIFIYQLTFFVALIALDQRRIQQNRLDCCVCFTSKTGNQAEGEVDELSSLEQCANQAMEGFAKHLLRPWVKAATLLVFVAFFGLCAWSTSKMKQEFKFTEILPHDSFMSAFAYASDEYSSDVRIQSHIYFRHEDQSDEAIQEQMNDFIADIAALDMFEKPAFCWLQDFESYTQLVGNSSLSFIDQLNEFLSIDAYNKLYSNHFVRDMDGTLLSSRCSTYVVNVNPDDANDQVDALLDQRAVTASQPINTGKADWSFFTYSSVYNMWECYSVLVNQLISTSILGMVAVAVISIAFIPHWTAAVFVMPLVIVLYIDLIGMLQMAGIDMNAVSYIGLVMSIGLTVDYLMHVLLRFYEAPGNRHEKVIDMFKTMGVSILVGGISTLLGTVPLAFSTSLVFHTIFIAFLGIVVLGLGHGLILLPVILSMWGPEEQVSLHS
jgi:Niemann-Pick C1 protein